MRVLNSNALDDWLFVHNPDWPRNPTFEHPNTPALSLYYASLVGCAQVVELLLERGADVNAQGGHYGNALQAALSNRHEEIAKLLLRKGFNIISRGRAYDNALMTTLYEGSKDMIALLLARAEEINALYRLLLQKDNDGLVWAMFRAGFRLHKRHWRACRACQEWPKEVRRPLSVRKQLRAGPTLADKYDDHLVDVQGR
jgi:ankyrin repeat protein